MPQQLVQIDSDALRVIEVGPIGPPGMRGLPGEDGSGVDNEIAIVEVFANQDYPNLASILTAPNPSPAGITLAAVGLSDELNGIYSGTSPASAEDPSDWTPMVRLGDLPTKGIIARGHATSAETFPDPGPFLVFPRNGAWEFVPMGGGLGGAAGAQLVDLRYEAGLPYSPSWDMSSGIPSDAINHDEGAGDPEEGVPPVMYLAVDLSVLPDQIETLVLLLRPGRWSVVPTAWPPHTRGPWSISFVFDQATDYNTVEMGTTTSEFAAWGFYPTPNNAVVNFHTSYNNEPDDGVGGPF